MKEDKTIDNLLAKGATSNLFKKPNSLSNIKGKPEFNAPLNAVKTISPAPKKFPYESTPGRKPSGAFEKSATNKKSQIIGCNMPAKSVDGLLCNWINNLLVKAKVSWYKKFKLYCFNSIFKDL